METILHASWIILLFLIGALVYYLIFEKPKPMKKVIFIEQPKEETKKPVEFTHYLSPYRGWEVETNTISRLNPNYYFKIVYLGKCDVDGDMFAAISDGGCIEIYKGHLNSGEY